MFVRKYKKFDGFLIVVYFALYSITRFIAEFYRAPDVQMGFYFGFLTMGQLLSLLGVAISLIAYGYLRKNAKPTIVYQIFSHKIDSIFEYGYIRIKKSRHNLHP